MDVVWKDLPPDGPTTLYRSHGVDGYRLRAAIRHVFISGRPMVSCGHKRGVDYDEPSVSIRPLTASRKSSETSELRTCFNNIFMGLIIVNFYTQSPEKRNPLFFTGFLFRHENVLKTMFNKILFKIQSVT